MQDFLRQSEYEVDGRHCTGLCCEAPFSVRKKDIRKSARQRLKQQLRREMGL